MYFVRSLSSLFGERLAIDAKDVMGSDLIAKNLRLTGLHFPLQISGFLNCLMAGYVFDLVYGLSDTIKVLKIIQAIVYVIGGLDSLCSL